MSSQFLSTVPCGKRARISKQGDCFFANWLRNHSMTLASHGPFWGWLSASDSTFQTWTPRSALSRGLASLPPGDQRQTAPVHYGSPTVNLLSKRGCFFLLTFPEISRGYFSPEADPQKIRKALKWKTRSWVKWKHSSPLRPDEKPWMEGSQVRLSVEPLEQAALSLCTSSTFLPSALLQASPEPAGPQLSGGQISLTGFN